MFIEQQGGAAFVFRRPLAVHPLRTSEASTFLQISDPRWYTGKTPWPTGEGVGTGQSLRYRR